MSFSKKHHFLLIILLIIGFIFSIAFFYISYQLKQIKEPAISFLKSQINGDVQIKEANISLFPAGLRLKQVRLLAPGDTEASATIEEVHLRFDLLQFFQKNIDTQVYVEKPSVRMIASADKKSNFEKIFEPMFSEPVQKSPDLIDKLWWKRLTVTKLVIHHADFNSGKNDKPSSSEIQNLDVAINDLHLISTGKSPLVKMSFNLPSMGRELIKFNFHFNLDQAERILHVEQGNVNWKTVKMQLAGEVLLPNTQRDEMTLNLKFAMPSPEVKNFVKSFMQSFSYTGDLSLSGTITGSPFSPVVLLALDSKRLNLAGKEFSNLHAEVTKKGDAIEIKKSTFGIYGGGADLSGNIVPAKTTSGNFNVYFHHLHLSSVTGKRNVASISGHLDLRSNNIEGSSYGGGGTVTVGPIPLPNINLKEKIGGAKLLSEGILSSHAINFGVLSNSANIIGTQIDQVTSQVSIQGGDVTLHSFHFSNSKISGSGSGVIHNQQTINASGTAVLSSGVVASIFPDPKFRSSVTNGRGTISIPFHVSGSLENPTFTFDESFLKNVIAKAVESGIKNLLFGNPAKLLNPILKNTPLKHLPFIGGDKDSDSPNIFKHIFGH